MNIQRLKRLIKVFLLVFFTLGIIGCKNQNGEKRVVEISSGIKIENDLHSYSEESVYKIGGQKYFLRGKAFYEADGSIKKLVLYKTEGTLEYEQDEILKDKKILDFAGFPLSQKWLYTENHLVSKNGETVKVQAIDSKILKSVTENRVVFYKIE